MPRRAAGEGTITKRKDGRWQGQLSIGYTTDGKRERRTVYGRTQKEVREKMEKLKLRITTGDFSNSKMTVAEYLAVWHKEKARSWKPRTIELYEHNISRHITPRIGSVPLDKLTPMHVQLLVGEIADAGRTRTANMCRTLLFSALKQAVRWQYVSRNVVEAVDPVKDEPKRPDLWTPNETMRFLEVIENHRLYPAFYLLITTGLRRGELLGLRWQDVHQDALRIEQTLTMVGNMPVISTPKTKNSRRWVSIPTDVAAVLDRHRQRQDKERAYLGESWTDSGLVFTSEVGTPMHPRNFYRTWRDLQKKAGVPRARIHDLRHLHVSLLVRRGLDFKVIADRLGHADPAFTLRRYTHLLEETQRQRAAISMNELLAGPDEPEKPALRK